jgi:hypothetical protein
VEEETMIKAIVGYDIMPNMTVEAYEKWLKEVHLPDLKRIPGLNKVVFNTVKGIVRGETTFYRISELHYENREAFEKAAQWRKENPVSKERSPEGKTDFKFYLICETEEFDFAK